MSDYNIIDRRTNPRGKNLPNRQKFLRRNSRYIKRYLDRNFQGNITDTGEQEVKVDQDDVAEHSFGYDFDSGNWNRVLPGNKEFVVGDTIPRPSGGSGSGGSEAGQGESQDDFIFHLSREEYFDIVFDGMELHNLEKKSQDKIEETVKSRAGFSHDGPTTNLDLVKTLKNSIGRRLALAAPIDREIKQLEEQLEQAGSYQVKLELQQQLEVLRRRRAAVCYIDPVDLRYRRYQQTPVPQSKAVMFCIMDVSASMTAREKEIAKRFYLLLYLFLTKNYKKVELVFIRHTDSAEEVTEQEFFYGTASGGTTVSTGIQLMKDIVQERYNPADWNIYAVQSTDGDNYPSDNLKVKEILQQILPVCQFYVYNEISNRETEYQEYLEYSSTDLFRTITSLTEQFSQLEVLILESADRVVSKFRTIFGKRKSKK
jgi:uncharacterized sporulation protein YeaH/YhbH (DUF444 family)